MNNTHYAHSDLFKELAEICAGLDDLKKSQRILTNVNSLRDAYQALIKERDALNTKLEEVDPLIAKGLLVPGLIFVRDRAIADAKAMAEGLTKILCGIVAPISMTDARIQLSEIETCCDAVLTPDRRIRYLK